ncbi:MAG TPA: prephenate dehydrogenase, partial [Microbacterium sp.]|nr:prephenate dehydrogenase [Microbacterium sp.]
MSDHARSREGVAPRVSGTVRIVGAGLLGASIGHALMARGVDVALDDSSPSQLRLAIDYGAGRAAADDDAPSLIVVAVPPDVTADVIERELTRFPDAVVTDVASVKLEPLHALRARGVDLTHYIGSHPMAGRERGGAISARADIFVGRPWVVCRDEETPASDLALVEALALELGATPIEMTPEDHDRSVALVSHVPQLVASLLAARFVEAPDGSLRLAGQGVRDTTRIASSAPELWVQILGANAEPVVEVLDALASDLAGVAAALRAPDAPLAALQIVPDEERRVLLDAWGTGPSVPLSAEPLHRLIEAQAAATPDAVAIVAGGERLTYAQLDAWANRVAGELRGRGAGVGVVVGVYVDRDLSTVPALLGILKTGAAYLPLDPVYPPDRIAWMLDDSGAALLLAGPALPEVPSADAAVVPVP